MISPNDRQRVLEMLDQRPPGDSDVTGRELDESMRSLLRDVAAVAPDSTMKEIRDIFAEHAERMRERGERQMREPGVECVILLATTIRSIADVFRDQGFDGEVRQMMDALERSDDAAQLS
ncbi:MAG: hypothetical protein O7H40_15950 [Gammaproteobacteria bacterium]|nr:hypothetical protein [Gammaproteobacteria bacterium]